MVTYAEDNPFPSVLFAEHVDPSNPGAGTQRLFVDTDHILKLIDSAGTVTTYSGAGLSDPMTSRGDIIIRNASNVTARLAKGSADTYLGSDGTDVSYSAVTDAKLSTSDITTNNASTSKHGFLKKLDNNAAHFVDGTGAWSTPSGGGSVTTVESVLSGSTVNVTSGADATIVSVSLLVGTYIVFGFPTIVAGTGGADYYCWIDDGSTVLGSGQMTIPGTSWVGTVPVITGLVTLGGTTTVNLKARSSGATGVAQITTPNGTKAAASKIVAIKLS